MKTIVRQVLVNLYFWLERKNLYLLILLLAFIVLQIYLLHNVVIVMDAEATPIDAALRIYGGLGKTFALSNLVNWVIMTVPILMLVQYNTFKLEGFDYMLLVRSGSKMKWWVSKVMSAVAVTAIYILIIVAITTLLSLAFFKDDNKWSVYASIYTPDFIHSFLLPQTMSVIAICIFSTGLISFVLLFLTLHFFCDHNPKKLFGLLVFVILLSVLHMEGVVPRFFSPLFYPSTLDLAPSRGSYLTQIVFNVAFSLFNVIAGTMICIRKNWGPV